MTPQAAEDRYARARLIDGWDAELLAASTAVVVGVGALGNETAKNLALAGVGRLILCDPDTVSVSNLSRTVLFSAAQVGMPKPLAAVPALRALAPDAHFEPRVADLVAGIGLGELADAGIVLGCLDNVRSRLSLLERCTFVGAPLVDGGTGSWNGEVRVRTSAADGCFGCTLSARERAASDLPRGCDDPPPAGPAAASIVATATVAAWMTIAALRILLTGTDPGYRMLRIDGLGGRTETVTIDRDPSCPYHKPLAGAVHRLEIGRGDTVRRLLDALPSSAEPYAWTRFAVAPRCARCGADQDVSNAPEDDGALACRRCGTLLRPRYSERISDADHGRTLGELGIAPSEILTVRLSGGGHECYRLT